eukprot:TRINITY_DN29881_c0_g1_i1.p1 TRINITY_DN29881_c0_g1~~TRINITY_DN29881_c0_g1_i1.p1  ORF type:complete len:109 (+),score=15.55 TRINITY_DN29881_c0_g1_i1:177-503(+)
MIETHCFEEIFGSTTIALQIYTLKDTVIVYIGDSEFNLSQLSLALSTEGEPVASDLLLGASDPWFSEVSKRLALKRGGAVFLMGDVPISGALRVELERCISCRIDELT